MIESCTSNSVTGVNENSGDRHNPSQFQRKKSWTLVALLPSTPFAFRGWVLSSGQYAHQRDIDQPRMPRSLHQVSDSSMGE